MIFGGCSPKNKIEIVKKGSFYSDFVVKGEKVYIKCELEVNNSTDDNAIVEFYASLPEEVKLGLLKNDEMKGYQENSEISEFSLPEGKSRIVVVFIGDFAGTNKKHDRNLPNIGCITKSGGDRIQTI